jgi:hypothetical protein
MILVITVSYMFLTVESLCHLICFNIIYVRSNYVSAELAGESRLNWLFCIFNRNSCNDLFPA